MWPEGAERMKRCSSRRVSAEATKLAGGKGCDKSKQVGNSKEITLFNIISWHSFKIAIARLGKRHDQCCGNLAEKSSSLSPRNALYPPSYSLFVPKGRYI